MQQGKLKFRDIFDGDKIFEIPEYQRAFTWGEKQLTDFLNDLKNQHIEKPYFFGTFLFHEAEHIDEYVKIFIVDGQQRLTTSNIFIKTVLDCLKGYDEDKKKTFRRYIEDDGIYKLNTSINDNAFYHTYIINNNKPTDFDTKSQKRLNFAKNYFENQLQNLSKKDLEDFLQKVENSFVLVHTVTKKSDAAQVFELINDRGKRLTDLEAIKSFLMYTISVLLTKPEQTLEDIENNFAKIYRKSEKLEDRIKEDQILTYYIITNLEWKGEEFRKPKDYIKKTINNTDQKTQVELVKKITKEIKESFEIIDNIISNKRRLSEIDDLFMLNRIANFYPLLMSAFLNDETDIKNDFKGIANLAELYSFISLVAGKRSDTGVKYFYELARDFEGDFNSLNHQIKKIFSENWWRIISRFQENIPNIDYYSRITKFVLFKYENYLRKNDGFPILSMEAFFENDTRLKLSIEHITARRVKSLDFSEQFKNTLLDNIGNLVIDTVASNSAKGAEEVDDKIKLYNLAPMISQNEIDKIVKDISKENAGFNWEKLEDVEKFIKYRRDKIKEFILKEWNYETRAIWLG